MMSNKARMFSGGHALEKCLKYGNSPLTYSKCIHCNKKMFVFLQKHDREET